MQRHLFFWLKITFYLSDMDLAEMDVIPYKLRGVIWEEFQSNGGAVLCVHRRSWRRMSTFKLYRMALRIARASVRSKCFRQAFVPRALRQFTSARVWDEDEKVRVKAKRGLDALRPADAAVNIMTRTHSTGLRRPQSISTVHSLILVKTECRTCGNKTGERREHCSSKPIKNRLVRMKI